MGSNKPPDNSIGFKDLPVLNKSWSTEPYPPVTYAIFNLLLIALEILKDFITPSVPELQKLFSELGTILLIFLAKFSAWIFGAATFETFLSKTY